MKEGDGKKVKAKAREDAKSNLMAPPTVEFLTYLVTSCGCVASWARVANNVALKTLTITPTERWVYSILCGFGPVLAALVVTALFSGLKSLLSDYKGLGPYLLHLTVGSLFCSLPITIACYQALEVLPST